MEHQDQSELLRWLSTLPKKVSAALSNMLTNGPLSESILKILADAERLSGDQHRLVGFCAGMLYLEKNGVPVIDTIRLAVQSNRSVRLDWSAARWKTEHERLSRAATLKLLSRENVQYATEDYRIALPPSFPGYLVKSSRRLGYEGFRQRHCVAGYHPLIMMGSCAICVVFYQKQRWTVQLGLSAETTRHLKLLQVRGRHNRAPTTDEMNAIRKIVGVASPVPVERGSDSSLYDLGVENLRVVLPVLRNAGIREVRVTFEGSGDSGCIDSIDADNGQDLPVARVDVWQRQRNWDEIARQFVFMRHLSSMGLKEALHELSQQFLDDADLNWWDNEGGYGELVLNVDEGRFQYEINLRETSSSCELEREIDIESGEDV